MRERETAGQVYGEAAPSSALEFEKSLLESQSEASLDGILVVSDEGRMLSFNRRFLELWNIPEDVVDSRSDDAALEHVREQLVDPDEFLARVAHLYEHPDEESREEIELLDGRIVDRYSAPVRDSHGRHYGRIWFFRDVTEARRAERELRERLVELDAVSRMAEAVGHADTLEEVLEDALDTLTGTLGLGRAAVLLLDNERVMRFRAWRGLSDEYRAAAQGHSPWPPGTRDPEPLLVADVDDDPALAALRETIRAEGIRSLAFVPLVHQRRLLGKFMLYGDEPGRFGRREVDFSRMIASHIAAAAARAGAQAELLESRDQLAVILREVADGITVQDGKGRIVFANEAAARQIGFSSVTELLATPLEEVVARFEILDEDRRPLTLEALPGRIALAGGSAEQTVCYRVRGTGEERWSLVRATPVTAPDGSVEFAINVFHDITERKRTEERVTFLAEASKLLASSLDFETTFASVARLAVPALADWTIVDMLEPDGSLRRVGAAHVDPAWDERLRTIAPPRGYRRVVAEGTPLLLPEIGEEDLRTAARGEEHLEVLRRLAPAALICVPLVSRGRTLGAITLCSSRPGRYGRAELALAEELGNRAALAVDNALLYREAQGAAGRMQESLALLDALLASAPVGVGFWDRELRYVRVNATLAELNGLSPEEHVGRQLSEVLPDLSPRLEPLYRHVLATGEPYEHQESTSAQGTSPGDERHWLSSYYPVKTGEGEIIGVGAVITEVTERRRAERERAARARQQAAVAALGQLALSEVALDTLLDVAVNRVAETLGVELAKVLELDGERSSLRLRAGVGWHGGLVGTATVGIGGDSQAGYTLSAAEPVVVDDLANDPRFDGPQLLRDHGVVSGMSIVIGPPKRPFGVLGAHSRVRRQFSAADVDFLQAVANLLAAAIERRRDEVERERLLESEQLARHRAERAAEVLRRVQAVTEATLAHLELNELLGELLERVGELLDTETAAVLLVDEAETELVAWAARGLEEAVERGVRIPLGAGFAGRIAAEGRPLAVEDVDHADVLNPVLREKGVKSLLGVPLRIEDRVIGVMHVGTLRRRLFDDDDRQLLQLVADRVALAIEQSRLYVSEREAREAAELAQARMTFLAEASRIVSSSLDYETTLRNLVDLAASTVADWTSVYLLDDDGSLKRIVSTHRDPEKRALADMLGERYPPELTESNPLTRVLHEGESVFLPHIPEEVLVEAARDDEHLRLIRALGLASAVSVPVTAAGRPIGAISFVREEAGRPYDEDDLALAEELGRRAGLAVENARLYQAAREQSALNEIITENAASALFMMDERGHPTYMNPAAVEMTGFTLEEIRDRPLHYAVHHTRPDGSHYPMEECPIDRALPQKRWVEPYEDVFVRKDGSFFPVLAAASPIVRDGIPVGTVVEVRDVTLEKQVEADREELFEREQAARREAEERAQAAEALEFVGDGVFLLDPGGVVRLWNPAAEMITGLPAATVVGRPALEAIDGWSELLPRVPTRAAGESGSGRPETLPLEVGGRELWLSISGVTFPGGTVYAFRDLTEERGLEKLKSDFVSTVSHELRTPLAAIYGAALTLRREDIPLEPAQQSNLLGVIATESERLARIVNDILWTSRIESGGLQVMIEECDAPGLAATVVAAAELHAPANITLRLDSEEGIPRVAADPDKVRQVLANLVENAIKYSPGGGEVTVRIDAGEGVVRFAVTDQGLGIPPTERERVFEKFYRLDPDLTQGVGGTGLGLYICRELVRRMEGRIWVDSMPGQGSTFVVELPSVADVAAHAAFAGS
jgi:PAS domain S-box-containing protein